ncbi:hypothetical protein J1N35_040027 [Gossypium stocksii]|uniref:Uncharacterized protein n=1 Tax=Gossypium stocksii TaxID=47602 RepID=A0A9D3UCQ6_9ROSI|nr:hypothetical protein J1N35_040027 [Gossypium stocksii]
MNTPIEKVEYDIPKLKNEGYFTDIERDNLSMGIQQAFGVEDCDEVLKIEEGFGKEVAHDVAISTIEEKVVVLTMKNKRLPIENYTTLRALTKFEDYSTIWLHIVLNRVNFLKLIFSRRPIEDNV